MEFARSKIKKKLLEQEAQKSEYSTPERVRDAAETPVRRRGRVSLRPTEQDPADAEGGNPDEEEEEAAASGGEVGWSAPASPQPPRTPPGSVHTVTNAVRVEQLAGESRACAPSLSRRCLKASEVMPTW